MVASRLSYSLGRGLELVLMVLLGILILLATVELFAWVLLERSFAPMEEVQGILMIWLGLLGAAYCLERRLHLSVNLLVDRFPQPFHAFLAQLASLCVFVFGGLLALYGFRLARAVTNTLPGTGWSASVQYLPAVVAGVLIAVIALHQFKNPDRYSLDPDAPSDPEGSNGPNGPNGPDEPDEITGGLTS